MLNETLPCHYSASLNHTLPFLTIPLRNKTYLIDTSPLRFMTKHCHTIPLLYGSTRDISLTLPHHSFELITHLRLLFLHSELQLVRFLPLQEALQTYRLLVLMNQAPSLTSYTRDAFHVMPTFQIVPGSS